MLGIVEMKRIEIIGHILIIVLHYKTKLSKVQNPYFYSDILML